MAKLDWQQVKSINTVPNSPVYEAEVEGGKYRAAPWLHIDRTVRYEAFFIPTGAKSMADVRDIAGSAEQGDQGLPSIDEAKAAAEHDYTKD
jgi:hypothetical protein